MKETLGKILRILTTVLMVLSQSVETVRLFRRYKGEQMAELQAEKDKIAEERRQSAEMLAELQALRAQLGQNAPEDGAVPVPDSAPGFRPPATRKHTPQKARFAQPRCCAALTDIQYACGGAPRLCTKRALFRCEAVLPK